MPAEATTSKEQVPVKLWKPRYEKNLEDRMTFLNLHNLHKGTIGSYLIYPHVGCEKTRVLKKHRATNDDYIWVCRSIVSSQSRHDKYLPFRTGNWLLKSNLTPSEILQITYFWSNNLSQ